MDSDIENKVLHCGWCVRHKTHAVPAAELLTVPRGSFVVVLCCLFLCQSFGDVSHVCSYYF